MAGPWSAARSCLPLLGRHTSCGRGAPCPVVISFIVVVVGAAAMLGIASITLHGNSMHALRGPAADRQMQENMYMLYTASSRTSASGPIRSSDGDWQCLKSCCWQRVPLKVWPYQGNVPGQPSGMELAHTDSFKALADISVFNPMDPIEKLSIFQGQRITPLDNRTAPCLQPASVIFAQQHWFHDFAAKLLPLINVSFILVTHDGDVVLPESDQRARALLDDPRLIHWFAMSCKPDHPKLTCLPLGPSLWKMNGDINNYNILADVMGLSTHSLVQGIFPSPLHPKSDAKQMLVNFNLGNHGSRGPLWQQTCNTSSAPLRAISTCLSLDYGRSMKDFFLEIAEHRFVLSPRGAGPDAYRTWETLLLGSYPIVPDQDIRHLYAGLPVLVLNDTLRELTPALLHQTYAEFTARTWQYHSLYIGHWYNKIYQYRSGYSKQYKFRYRYSSNPA